MEAASSHPGLFIERRRLPRLKVTAPIQFRNVLKPQEPFTGTLSRDMSAGGIRITAPQFLPKDARLVMTLSLPTAQRFIRTIAQVMWVQRERFAENYHYGIRFIEVVPEDRDLIHDFVERGILLPPAASPARFSS